MCEICKPIHELPWLFLWQMLHVLRHDEYDIGIDDKKQQHYIINKIINIAIRSTLFHLLL